MPEGIHPFNQAVRDGGHSLRRQAARRIVARQSTLNVAALISRVHVKLRVEVRGSTTPRRRVSRRRMAEAMRSPTAPPGGLFQFPPSA